MKFNAQKLWFALNWCSKCISKDCPLTMLEDILVVVENSSVTVVASNLAETCMISYPVNDMDVIRFPINKKMVRLIKKVEEIEVIVDQTKLIFLIGNKKITTDITGFDHLEYEQFTKTDNYEIVCTTDKRMIEDLKTVMNFTTTDYLRPAMTGINISTLNEQLTMVASDGHKLIKRIAPNTSINSVLEFVIHHNYAKILSGLRNIKEVRLKVDSNKLRCLIETGWSDYSMQFFSRLIPQKYPDFEAVIPKHKHVFIVSRNELLRELVDSLDWINQTTHQIKFFLNENRLEGDNEYSMSQFQSTVKIDNESQISEIVFNAKYMIDILRASKQEVCRFHVNEMMNSKPVYLEEENGILLIMPVIIY